jgi:hypothetical protein
MRTRLIRAIAGSRLFWIPFIDEGTLLVLSERTREVQRISDISEKPVICEGAPTS